ncbi:MAG: zinc-finger domain-containing protein [Pseudomonadota bacterium]|nr:zinc-finger domain-containing protein [Pseudomonadota bacterium]
MSTAAIHSQHVIEVTEADLPLHCPLPADSLWSGHPRVFIPVREKGEACCPYCGTLYKLQDWNGQARHAH